MIPAAYDGTERSWVSGLEESRGRGRTIQGSTKERSLVAGVEYDELEEPVLMYPFHRPSETVRELSLHDEHKGGRGLSKSQPSSLSDKSSG